MPAVGEIDRLRVVDRVQELVCAVLHEGKAVSFGPVALVRQDRILQAAGLPDDRHRTIAHSDQLSQAAGLEQTRHQQCIGSGVDLVSQGFIVRNVGADASLVLVFKIAESVLVAGIARTENDHLGVSVDQLREDRVHQVEALLVRQAGDQAQDHLVRVRIQAELFLQGKLVRLLFIKYIFHGIRLGKELVRRGIPLFHINAVHDAAELRAVIAEMPVQVLAEGRCLDLLGIGLADRGNLVRKGQAALEHVGLILVVLEDRVVEQVIRQPGPVLQVLDAADALEPEIVDCQDGPCLPDRGVLELPAQVDRQEGCLPVMAVNDLRHPFQVVHDRQGSFGEEAVLRDILPQTRIGIAPVKELPVLDKVVGHAVQAHLHDSDKEGPSFHGQVHHEGALVFQLFLVFPRNTGIQGKDHAHLAPLADQRAGQRVHHVAQPARLDERIAFRADKGDPALLLLCCHGFIPPLVLYGPVSTVFLFPALPAAFISVYQIPRPKGRKKRMKKSWLFFAFIL